MARIEVMTSIFPTMTGAAAYAAQTWRSSHWTAAFLCLAMAVLNHSIFALGRLSWIWAAILVATVALVAFAAHDVRLRNPAAQIRPIHWTHALIGLLVAAPVVASLILGWRREFPFSGDHYFHVGQSYRMAFWWLSPVASLVLKVPALDDLRQLLAHPAGLITGRLVLLAAICAIVAAIYRYERRVALLFAAVALVVFGLAEHTIFLRYPGGAYFLGIPFLGPAWLFNNIELTGRLNSVAALVTWLFVLRPWIVGSWPDARILPAAALLFWHKDIVYYFDAVYLEPWAVVMALLAVETLVERGREGASAACLLTGLAAAIKEPMVLALPFMWLAGAPWQGPWQHRIRLTGAAIAAGVPFILYYVARKNLDFSEMGVDRLYELNLSFDGLIAYASGFAYQVSVAYPGTAALVVIATFAVIPFVLWRAADPLPIAACVAAGLAIMVFFAFDANSIRWAGYFRFLLISIPFLAVGMIALGRSIDSRTAWLAGTMVLALQAPGAYVTLSRAAGPATDRNFVEHFDAPLVFPTRSIIGEAERSGFLPRNAPVLANLADATIRPLPGERLTYGQVGELICECKSEHPYVLATFIRFTNQGTRHIQARPDLGERLAVWQGNRADRPACLARMRQTCAHVLQREEGGELVAIFGADPK